MSINCSHEKNDILYNKVRDTLKHGNFKRILSYDVETSDQKFESRNLETFVPGDDKGKRPIESMVVSECYSRDKPLDVRECQTGEFWDYLLSEDWSQGSSLRVLTGRLQNEINTCLDNMEKFGLIMHQSTYAYAVNLRRRKICFRNKKPTTGMDDIMTRRETILLEFKYYGPYREDKRPNYRKLSGSSGYQESYTSPFPPFSSSSLPTSGAERREKNVDVDYTVEGIQETNENIAVTSTLQTRESTDNLPQIRSRHAQQQSLKLNSTAAQKEIRISVKEETVLTSSSSCLPEQLLPLVCSTTFSTKKRTPALGGSHTSIVERSYISRKPLQQSGILTQSISGHSAEDSRYIDTVSSQTKKSHIPSMALANNIRYSGSSTDSSLISETGTLNLQNFFCTEKMFYLGSFELDSQSDSESSESDEDGMMERLPKVECVLGDVSSRKEHESVLNKLRRRNQKRIEDRKQRKIMINECTRTLPSVMQWSDVKEEDVRAQHTSPAKELFSDAVPDFTHLNNISEKYRKEAMMLKKAKFKQRARERRAARQRKAIQNNIPHIEQQLTIETKIAHVEQPIIQTNHSDNIAKFAATVGGITDSAACRQFYSDHLKLLEWLESHNLQHTLLYQNLKTLKETTVMQKIVDEALSLPRPELKKENVRMRLGDVAKNNATQTIKQKKKEEEKRKKLRSGTEKDKNEINNDKEKKTTQRKKKLVDSIEEEKDIPLKMVTRDTCSEEEDLSDFESSFNVKKLNLRYSIEDLRNKKQTEEKKPDSLDILRKYYRIQTIARAFCRNQSEEGITPTVQLPRVWEKKLQKRDGFRKYRQKSEMIGRIKWFPFLSKADVKRKSSDVNPAFEMIYTKEFLVNKLLKAMETFVVRKEIVVSDHKGETCTSITFTKPFVFQNYKKFDATC